MQEAEVLLEQMGVNAPLPGGVAKANGQAFLMASRDLPATDPLTLEVEDERLFIERRSVRCDWIEFKPRRSTVRQ
jgi:hypothetical protein